MSPESDPFLLPDHPAYPEIMTDAAVNVLRSNGVTEFSVSKLARWMKVTPQALLNMYSRARAIELIAICFSRRWERWSISEFAWQRTEHPCPLALPKNENERHGVRVLGVLEELAEGERLRGNPLPSRHFADLRRDEMELLSSRLVALRPGQEFAPAATVELEGLFAFVSGLRRRLADSSGALTWEQARELFACAVNQVSGSVPDGRTTPPEEHPRHEPAA